MALAPLLAGLLLVDSQDTNVSTPSVSGRAIYTTEVYHIQLAYKAESRPFLGGFLLVSHPVACTRIVPLFRV